MKKYIAVQVAPEAVDYDYLYNDDYITGSEGMEYAVIGLSNDYYREDAFLNADLYKEINQAIEEIEEAFEDIRTGEGWYSSFYSSYKDAVSDILNKYCTYSPRLVADLKKLFKHDYTVAEFLTVITRKRWTEQGFRGYCQGDYCTLIYCEEVHKDDYINILGEAAVGCVSEFSVSENRIETEGRAIDNIIEEARTESYFGIYCCDDDLWGGHGRELIAEQIGAKPDEVEILTIEGSRTVVHYDYKIAG